MNNKILHGQTAIVTGAGRGIGKEIAIAPADAGANVVVCARNKKEISDTADFIINKSGKSTAIQADVTNIHSAEMLVKEALNSTESIELLVNNAGVSSSPGRIWEMNPEVWWNTIAVNLMGAFNLSHFVMKAMIKNQKGRIINIGSNAALYSLPDGYSAYSTSKAGLLRLTGSIAAQGIGIWYLCFCYKSGTCKNPNDKRS